MDCLWRNVPVMQSSVAECRRQNTHTHTHTLSFISLSFAHRKIEFLQQQQQRTTTTICRKKINIRKSDSSQSGSVIQWKTRVLYIEQEDRAQKKSMPTAKNTVNRSEWMNETYCPFEYVSFSLFKEFCTLVRALYLFFLSLSLSVWFSLHGTNLCWWHLQLKATNWRV